MKDLYKIDRRKFLEYFGVSAATMAFFGSGLEVMAQSNSKCEDAPNTHNMLVFGEKTVYLSHLPMFDGIASNKMDYASPHRYQVILEVSFQKNGQNLQNIYTEDRRKNAGVRIYTLNPEEFVLSRLLSANVPSQLLKAFKGKVFRGHLEKGGQVIAGLDNVDVKVSRVVHFRRFNAQESWLEKLKYLLFGNSQETFLAHYISKPPDFDQMLLVKVVGNSFTDAELSKGIEVIIPNNSNKATERIKEGQQVTGLAQTTDAQTLTLNFKADKEIYFEEGELLVPPTFDDTKLEQTKN